jgi:hypothetical protein
VHHLRHTKRCCGPTAVYPHQTPVATTETLDGLRAFLPRRLGIFTGFRVSALVRAAVPEYGRGVALDLSF